MERLKRQLCAAVAASRPGGNPDVPESGRELWNAFQRLSSARTYHAGGPNPIQISEVAAWCQIMRLPLEPRHVDILLAMDQAWLDRAYAKAQVPEGVKALPPVSKHALNAGLLDAIMG